MKVDLIQDLRQFIDGSPTMLHAAASICRCLQTAGFQEIAEADRWQVQPGGKYFVQRNGSAVIAFAVADAELATTGFRLLTAHTDSPALKLKLPGEVAAGGQLQVPVEIYGGIIHSTWLDRPLGVAGRLAWGTARELRTGLYQSTTALAVVPNLAVHLNREINQGFAYNPRQHMSAYLGKATPADFQKLLAQAVGCPEDVIPSYELFLHEAAPVQQVGIHGDLLCGSRFDNLASCHAALQAMVTAGDQEMPTAVAFWADHEEVGNVSAQGANSSFLRDILRRLHLSLGGDEEDWLRTLARSSLLSMDAAHAVHPSYLDKYDRADTPVLGGGVVIKSNASQRYCTNLRSASRFAAMCRQEGIACQAFTNRADMPCGSTIGPACAALLGIEGLDVGAPIWAMHSIRETAAAEDHLTLAKAAEAFLRY